MYKGLRLSWDLFSFMISSGCWQTAETRRVGDESVINSLPILHTLKANHTSFQRLRPYSGSFFPQTECFGAIIISPWSCSRKVATENVDITDYDSMSIKLYWFIKMLSGKDYNSIWGNTQERQVYRDRWAASCLEQGFFWVMTIFYKKTISW